MEVFERFEKKYLLDQARYEALLPLLLPHMEADVFPESRIGSIYYDTKTCLLIRKSLEKPLFKEKLRLRAYSLPAEDTRVFLEMKRKYKGLGYKRRAALPYGKALRFLAGEAIPEADSQIFRELRSFLSRYPDLRPCMFIGSDRLSYRGQERKDLRITLDRNIRYRREDPYLHLGFHGAPLLKGISF